MNMKILITGGSGFVGSSLAKYARSSGLGVRVSSRKVAIEPLIGIEFCQVADLGPDTDWLCALSGVDVVVHCAGRAHVSKGYSGDSMVLFRLINTEGTLNLAKQAAKAGVRRFVYISSVGVNGIQSQDGFRFNECDQPRPHNAYSQSKLEAEEGLRKIAACTKLEVVIIRPTLVYGANAPGNFGALQRAVLRGLPFPLGSVRNKRSLVNIFNLVDFIVTCITHPQAANQTFLVSDGEDVSTVDIIIGLAGAARIPYYIFPVPVWLMRLIASVLDRREKFLGLCGNLQIDISKAREMLGWEPKVSVKEGLSRAME